MKPRTKARSVALQVLYEMDQTNHPIESIMERRRDEISLDDNLFAFSQKIIHGVFPLISELDAQLARYAPEWPVDQVAIIDRNILRIALWELLFNTDTPLKVVINEAIELGKVFGADATPRFVNGVLGSLVENQNEIRQQFKI
ncbi:MAG: transcription antitermination factor NusB [Anaerolinea sp.]|nr:transcription antitermination factor NusB [Anaerolinea sp.]